MAGNGRTRSGCDHVKARQFDVTQDCRRTPAVTPWAASALAPGQTSATVLVETNPLQTAQVSIFVFEDNSPTNGDIDGNEENQGLGGFQITINDTAGRTGDPAGADHLRRLQHAPHQRLDGHS